MITIDVRLGERAYPIHIGADLLDRSALLVEHLAGKHVMVVTNDRVAPLYLDRVERALDPGRRSRCILADGEQHKTLASVDRLITDLLRQHFARDCVLVALGGGVVGDITGFAAAVYQRGVDFLQIPTTLLAQVDSAVGGKTAVNHPLGKNMIGAFHQPIAVISDLATLATLADREYRAGLAEVVKYGLIRDAAFFQWLCVHADGLVDRDIEVLTHAVRRSCEIKADVVVADERELGVRAILNLGHTFAHAIETGLGYGTYLHGEAVAIGLCLALSLSQRMGLVGDDDVAATTRLLRAVGLPTELPAAISGERMLALMAVDKKVRSDRIRFVLVDGIGAAKITADVDPADLVATLDTGRRTIP